LLVPIEDFPRYPLTFGPSPIHPLDRLTEHLGGAKIWAKREDVNSGLAYGGNKTRKLEYLIPDALALGADTLVSIGGVQSNHTRQVAAVAAKLGLKAVLVQERWVDWPDPVNDKVGNILLSRIMGADVRLDPSGFGIEFKDSWQRALEDVKRAGGTPYAIPAGASALVSPTGRTRCKNRSAISGSSSTRSWSAASPAPRTPASLPAAPAWKGRAGSSVSMRPRRSTPPASRWSGSPATPRR
jgi:1-aminocyclopropane-1-carboxylate deaminase